jgi:nitrogen fixation/metabolism regulation signal transduction histidine kinase
VIGAWNLKGTVGQFNRKKKEPERSISHEIPNYNLQYYRYCVAVFANKCKRQYGVIFSPLFQLTNITAVLALGFVCISWLSIVAITRQAKEQVFGAKLMLRLTIFFSLIAILPGLLVYAVSVQFLGKSIESWFDIELSKR